MKSQGKRNKEKGTSFERYIKSLVHAIEGFVYTFKNEHNVIIIVISTILVFIFGLFFNISHEEWLFVITMCSLVFATEMINTSIEATIDLVTNKYHPLAKIAKDTASTATLVLSVGALIGGVMIFIPKIIMFFGG